MKQASIVVVTGVSSGIGRATAQLFAAQGHRVFGTVRKLATAASLSGVERIEMDVTDDLSVQAGIQRILERSGRIDILVNNAGVSLIGSVEETSIQEATALFDTNLLGTVRTIQAVLPQMRRQGSGRIVNLSSVVGFLPAPYMGFYAASKHALAGLSETLDHEVRQFGVRVSLVEPAYTRTQLDANSPHAAQRIPAYDTQHDQLAQSISRSIAASPGPERVAKTVLKAAIGPWRLHHTPPGLASFLRRARHFLPAGLLDTMLRKSAGLA